MIFRQLPRNFVFEVTSKCGHGCVYCYNAWTHAGRHAGAVAGLTGGRRSDHPSAETAGEPPLELGLPEWKSIVGRLKREANPRSISISGGEPLLWPGTLDLVRFIREAGISVNLLTNGALLTEAATKALVEAGTSLFQVPLAAADAALHKALSGAEDFDKVLEGIANIPHFGGRVVSVFVATNRNIGALRETLELSVALGSSGLMFNRVNPARPEHLSLLPSAEQLKEALSFLDDFSARHGFPVFSSVPLPPCVVPAGAFPAVPRGLCPAGGRGSYYTVDFKGNVRPCNHSRLILGSILRQDLASIVKGKAARAYWSAELPCMASCRSARSCRGSCRASAEVCRTAACSGAESLDSILSGALKTNDPFVEANLKPPAGA